jgi:hypothetical protein
MLLREWWGAWRSPVVRAYVSGIMTLEITMAAGMLMMEAVNM